MYFKENILKSVIFNFLLISFFTTLSFSQSLEFVYPDTVFQYIEEVDGSHSIYFTDSGPDNNDISNYSFEFLEENDFWLNVVDSIFIDSSQFYIQFYGTPDDSDFGNTSFTLIVNKNLASIQVNDTLEFEVDIQSINDRPQIIDQNSLFYLKNSNFQLSPDDFIIEDPDNNTEDFSINIFPGDYYTITGDVIFVEQDFLGQLLIDIEINDGELENNLSEIFSVIVDIVAEPQITSVIEDVLTINEDEYYSFQIEYSDEDTQFPSEFNIELTGNASNWLSINEITLNGGGDFAVSIGGNPDDINLNHTELVFIIYDDYGNSDFIDILFEINPVNDAPIIEDQVIRNVNEDSSFQIYISDLLIYDPPNENDDFNLILFEGENYTFDSTNSIQPDSNFYGDLIVNIQISDNNLINNLSNTFQFRVIINPVNDSPIFFPYEVDTLYFIEEVESEFQVKFIDPDDTDPLDFEVNAIDNSSEWYMQYSISKEENEYTIYFTGTPDDVDVYDIALAFEIIDEFGLSDQTELNTQIESINDANPEIISYLNIEEELHVINEDSYYSNLIVFSDIDNHPADVMSIELDGPATSWLSYDENLYQVDETYQFTIYGTPNDYNYDDNYIAIKISDYDLGYIQDTIQFHILSINDSPVEIITDSEDLDAAFGAVNYSTTIKFQDIDNHDLSDYEITISDVTFNGNIVDTLLEIGELNYFDGEYYFDVFGFFHENLERDICVFDIVISDEIFYINQDSIGDINESITVTKRFILPILPNTPPIPQITLSQESGLTGSYIYLSSELSYDINSDIDSYLWSVKPVIRKETYIDINQNGIFDSYEPYNDINQNGIYEYNIEQEIYAEIDNITSSSSILTIPETFEDADITVELIITDNKGASGKVESNIRSVNPKLLLGNISGNQSDTVAMPISFEYLPDTPIYSLDLQFNWNTEEFSNQIECSSMSYYPSVIGDYISTALIDLPESFQYQINDTEIGRLGIAIFSLNGDPLNTFMHSDSVFAEINIPLTGFHGESDIIYISKFDINESTYGFNSNETLQNGQVAILGDKIAPLAAFLVKDVDGNIITENDSIYSGTELEFEIITICAGDSIPVVECDNSGHNLLGNGLNQQYSWDFDNDGVIDQNGLLNGNTINEYTYSITGFENIIKTAVLNIETAYGCATNQFDIDIEPLIPIVEMSQSGNAFDYSGDPGSINLKINQIEDMEALDIIINYDPLKINIIDFESQINTLDLLNQGAHYTIVHNALNGQLFVTAYSDSINNYTFFREDFNQLGSIKFYALQPGNTDISITTFQVDEISFLSNIGQNSVLTLQNNIDNEGQYDCNLNGIYDEGEEYTDSNENGIYDEGEQFIDVGDLNGVALIDQCGICTGGMTNLIPNGTQDCQGTCMPPSLLDNIDINMSSDYIYFNNENYSLLCEEDYEGFNIGSQNCEVYIGLESTHPLAGANGIDLCGICGGNNNELNGQYIGSNIDCNGYCSEETPNASDQYGFCGCNNDADGLYPDIYGLCSNGENPVLETGLCSDIFNDLDLNGIWNLNGGDSIIQKIDTTTVEFSSWGYKYLNFDPNALNDDGSCSRGVVINEFFFSPVQGTSVPDYIELLNMTPFDLDISEWSINGIQIDEVYDGPTPIMSAGKHFLISTGLPFYNIEGELFFPGYCENFNNNCIPNSLALNINLGINNGQILIEDYTIMDYLNYSDEAYWPVGAPYIGHSVELIEPYKSRNLSSNWMTASEYFPNPYMATEDGEWDVSGGYNYGTPSSSNNAYNLNHSENCNEDLFIECNLTKYDCDDVFNGLAFNDLCGICAGGSTSNQPSVYDYDLGICSGNQDIIDCACTCYTESNFGAVVDDCGQCTLGNSGSFDLNGNIVIIPNDNLECESDSDCTIWGMVCNFNAVGSTGLCHHQFEGQKDICGTCRSGPECDGTNDDICDLYFNIPEDYSDVNQDGFYNLGEPFIDLNGDEIRNDGVDDCNVCTENAMNVYIDSNQDGQVSPCFDGDFDEYGNWISNCPDWQSVVEITGCPVDCLGDIDFDGSSDDVIADLDECGQCIECSTYDCLVEEDWNNSCIYDFSVETDMNILGIKLNWTPHLDYDYYQIFKDGQLLVDSLDVIETQYVDSDVTYPNTYCYYIMAFNELEEFTNPSPQQCASIDYYGNIQFGEFQFSENSNTVGINVDVSDEMDTISIYIGENIIIDTLINGLFDDNWYVTELTGNNFKIYPNNPNSSLEGFLELGDIVFTQTSSGLDDSFCIIGAELDPHYDVLYPDGFIAQLPACAYFGCINPDAFNFNENATIDDGSCQIPYYTVSIDPTGNYQNIIISAQIPELEVGDEIAVYDASGILSAECPSEYGDLLVGSNLYSGEDVEIDAIRATPCTPFNPNIQAEPGFVPGNDIIIKVWRHSSQIEMIYSVAEQGHVFSGNSIIVTELNIPLYYQLEIETTGNFQPITFGENLMGLEYGDHIGVFDYAGISSTECPAQFDTVLVGSGFYENETLTIDAIRATPCHPIFDESPAEPGFVVNNEIIIKIWRNSEQMEYIAQFSLDNPYLFGTQELIVDEILTNDFFVVPNEYHLYPVYPNPFNPIATIQYDIPEISYLSIEVFNVLGKRVAVLFNGTHHPGMHQIKWDGSNQPSGLYLIRMTSPKLNFIEKIMLVK